jgi:hypothetical protein
LNRNDLLDYILAYPDIAIQDAIVRCLDKMISSITLLREKQAQMQLLYNNLHGNLIKWAIKKVIAIPSNEYQ